MFRNTQVRLAAVLLALGVAAPVLAADTQLSDLYFAHPERIRYDNRSLIIDGKPIFIYSGAIHYFRCPKELWKDRLQKLKDAGFNCVETYLAWNVHEPTEPSSPDDFSKLENMQDISDFIQTARDLGLYVQIRPGPYICAEWDRGGFPEWLMKHRPADVKAGQFLRGNSPEMLAWDRHWFAAAAKVVKPHLVTNLPPGTPGVINWQIENEYSLNGLVSNPMKADVLRALAHAAIDNGIDVPLFTCETNDKLFRDDPFLRTHVYETVNRYPGFAMQPLVDRIEERAAYQPEKFRATTELQGGWFAQVGGKLSDQQGHNAAQINQLTLTAIEHGVTSINYYMFYGGSNFGYGAAYNLIQSYDYNAPLREWGGEGDRYYAVKAIAQMLKEHGDQLIHSDLIPLEVKEGADKEVSIALRSSADGSCCYFVRNSNQKEGRKGAVIVQPANHSLPPVKITYNLDPFGAKIVYFPASPIGNNPELLPKTIPMPPAVDPKLLPAAASVKITSIKVDGSAGKWIDVPDGKGLDSIGIYDQRYVTYRVNFDLTADDLKTQQALRIRMVSGGDRTVGRINGVEIASATGGRSDFLLINSAAHEGHNTAEILFENHGCPNGGAGIEEEQGITQVELVPLAAQTEAVTDWRMKIITGSTNKRPELTADFDDRAWEKVAVDSSETSMPMPNSNAIYRGTLEISKEQLDAGKGGVTITFGCVDDSGTLYVNGARIGNATSWEHPWSFDITPRLHVGKNIIAMLVHNEAGGGGLYKGCYIDPVGRNLSHLQVAPETRSVAERWTQAKLEAGPDSAPSKLLSWYQLEFRLPAPSKEIFVPWHLHLEADANAFVFLNGHNLGRYWAIGPQRDFWLPECWLNAGPDAVNVISLQARPTVDGEPSSIIKAVEVRPYAEYAVPLGKD